jgi:hypothetical protein
MIGTIDAELLVCMGKVTSGLRGHSAQTPAPSSPQLSLWSLMRISGQKCP